MLEGGSKAPKGYIEYRLMKELGWTYAELQATPAEVVWNILRYISTENKHVRQRAK